VRQSESWNELRGFLTAKRKRPPRVKVLKLVMHENRKQQNDRQRHADKPKQCTFSKAHVSSLLM
jgi:hypothetical protein